MVIWEKPTTYFKYPAVIHKLVYMTNTIEDYHRQIRKVTKTKGSLLQIWALLKLMYLGYKNIENNWTRQGKLYLIFTTRRFN